MSKSKKPYEVIGICGNQGTGKDYIGKYLANNLTGSTLVVSFADHFKVDAISKHGSSMEKIYGQKDYETRSLLQRLGTEEGRNRYGDDIWINTVETWMEVYHSRGIKRFIITDVRFLNESRWVKNIGGILIKLNADDRFHDCVLKECNGDMERYRNITNHLSEQEINSIQEFDLIVDNSKQNQKNVLDELRRGLINIFGPQIFSNSEQLYNSKVQTNVSIDDNRNNDINDTNKNISDYQYEDMPLGYFGFYG
jgi:hypothetical protein